MKRVLFAGAIALSGRSAANAGATAVAPQASAYVPVVAPVYNWSGIYIGINGGYAFGQSDWSPAAPVIGTGNFDTNGGLVGGTLGVNFQTGQVVFGIEGDGDWADIRGNLSSTTPTMGIPACGPGLTACTYQTSSDWLATFRGRVGYAFGRVMIYATGGGAAGNVQATFSNPNKVPTATGSTDSTEFGWTAGGGIEAALTENITAKVEYLFVDLQDGNCGATICAAPASALNVPVSFDASVVRAGLNFKFNPF